MTEHSCAYCGLPVAAHADSEPVFCCFGCRFAASITGATGDDAQARWMMTRLGIAVFFTMNVMVFTLLLWSQPEHEAPTAAAAALYGLARHACLLFTAPVVILLGGPLLEDALAELRRGRAALNLLLLAGVVAAFAQSAWATWAGTGHVYFEVSCMVLVAVTLGRWLEASGKLRTTAALRELRTLLPDRVRRLPGGDRAREHDVALATVVPGDVLRVLPGEYLPTDGTIVAGRAGLDERTVTGESEPVVKQAGGTVYSGTLDLDGELLVEVTAAPGAGTLERLIDAVTMAVAASREERLAERLSAWFLPVVLVVAAAAGAVQWLRVGPAAGVLAALAVVVVSCPCALGLATPMALWAAVGNATRRHVLVRNGDAFAALAAADVWCFDKTGTLTSGCRLLDEPDPAHLALAAGLGRGSTHVHAAALVAAARNQGIEPASIDEPRTFAGCGVEGVVQESGAIARLGSPRWLGVDRTDAPCVLAVAGTPVEVFRFAEQIRPEASAAVAALEGRGGRALILSGDRPERVAAVAEALGIGFRAPLLPADKLAVIAEMQRAGRRVVMVGDGLNDAPALAAADVGVALGCGADVSRWSADVCLLADDLGVLDWLVGLAGRTTRTIRWNLVWAFGYNAACIPLAATGLVHPALAAAAMVASSLFVVTNSLALTDADA
ncbi:MAG: heavy metal translocating P-type ATPase [Planctomycetia bacterium]